MNIDTGGPAFPAPAGVQHITEQGMTLRDYFAAKAMQALIEKYDESPVEISLEAYEFADAMLKQREVSK
jgi:hypothetical protein